MTHADPDTVTHAFRTFLGLPPDKLDSPVCGAVLTDAYDFPKGILRNRPICPSCLRIIQGATNG